MIANVAARKPFRCIQCGPKNGAQCWVNLRGNLKASFFNISATIRTVYHAI
jgi:hypothetical protein